MFLLVVFSFDWNAPIARSTGLATTGLIGAEIGIGVVFRPLILGVARNPSMRDQLFFFMKQSKNILIVLYKMLVIIKKKK